MVRKVPGTDVEVSKEGVTEAWQRASKKLGCCFVCFTCLMAPVLFGFILFPIVYGVASLVFAIQGLVVGSATYNTANQPCEHTTGVWMIVFGSLVLGNTVLSCCCNPGHKKEAEHDDDENNSRGSCICLLSLIRLAVIGWLCYGMSIVYSPSSDHSCESSQYNVFQLIVLFMFYGMVAMVGTAIILLCTLCPILVMIKSEAAAEEQRKKEQTEQEAAAAAAVGDQLDKMEAGVHPASQPAVAEKSITDETKAVGNV